MVSYCNVGSYKFPAILQRKRKKKKRINFSEFFLLSPEISKTHGTDICYFNLSFTLQLCETDPMKCLTI